MVNLKIICVAIIGLAFSGLIWAAGPQNPPWPQKWNYVHVNFANDKDADSLITLLKLSKEAGCTHISLGCTGMGSPSLLTNPDYLKRVAKVRAVADQLKLALVPSVLSVGYCGEMGRENPDLFAGLPVRNMPFIIKGKTSAPDPTAVPELKNPGFEDSRGAALAGWDQLPANMQIDTAVKHGGRASLRVAVSEQKEFSWDDEELTSRPAGTTLNQKLTPTQFQYFKISAWVKAQGYKVSSNLFTVSGLNGQEIRKLTQWFVPLTKEQQEAKDWIRITVYFNTLDAKDILVQLGAHSVRTAGTLWVDDVQLEPAGMMLALRRLPLVVTSEDGKTTYAEGKDYKPVIDEALANYVKTGDLDVTHAASPLELTANSAIKDGQKVLISFYNTTRINSDQDVVTMQDPRALQIFEEIAKALVKAWPASGYFLTGYDEIRICGWEPNPKGEVLTPGQILDRHLAATCRIMRKYAPKAKLYTWEDMFSPYHNAKPGVYFLCNGNYEKAWEGLPADMIIMNWYAPSTDALKFFSNKGYHQVLCGYYDATDTKGLQDGLREWFTRSADSKNIDGMMYTTWSNNFNFLKEFFQLVGAYPNWAAP